MDKHSVLNGTFIRNIFVMGSFSLGMAGVPESSGDGSGIQEVWVLSSATSPQPTNRLGFWDDGENWNDTNVWYD